MARKDQLSAAEREFFGRVARAAFSNPFGAERLQLDREIAGVGGRLAQPELIRRTMARIREAVGALEEQGRADLRRFSGDDRELLRSALLFEAFHRHAAEFDQLIRQQVADGEEPCAVPFAKEVLALLARRGLSAEEARRTFAFFFQMRRAFYFIAHGLVGTSPCMGEFRRHLWNNVFTHDIRWYERHLWNRMEDFSTLLLGETGTGKGAAAAAIGRSGFIPFDEARGRFAESFTRNFVSINLSQYPEALIESELFGHKKGAFTGAIDHHRGIFARCSAHGAIFLDEIGDVSVPVQIKLLQILQERTFSPVGSHEKQRFSGRVIAATNRPLEKLREQGEFRDDFFYRLSSDVIAVPSLLQRLQEDPRELEVLLELVVERTIGEGSAELVSLVKESLAAEPGPGYGWPGNVRELEQAVRRILLTRSYRGELPVAPGDLRGRLLAAVDGGTLDAQGLLAGYCALLYRRLGTYEQVAKVTGLDRRTVKKYVLAGDAG
ncbi:sigma 54-interacting transcriptional regulator [Desulfuromonas versatilis]|nr:sigma 54-interacting transcriptional regulator [Desulfuromonas versatilis]